MADDERPVGNKPSMTEDGWHGLAIATAIAALLAGVAGSIWILGLFEPDGINPSTMEGRGRALTPIGTFLIAIVTFCTVAWRVKVTERQASAQERQLESADENNLAVLLQKGAELLSDEDEGKVAAGIACLEAVVTAKNRRFGTQAMNLLGKYIERKHQQEHENHLCQAAIAALEIGKENSCIGTFSLTFIGRQYSSRWNIISGGGVVHYRHGSIRLHSIFSRNQIMNCRFEDVKLSFSKVYNLIFPYYYSCIFENCLIKDTDITSIFANRFDNCDFSGTKFRGKRSEFEFLDFSYSFPESNCYFYTDDPPICKDEAFLSALRYALEARDPTERDNIPF